MQLEHNNNEYSINSKRNEKKRDEEHEEEEDQKLKHCYFTKLIFRLFRKNKNYKIFQNIYFFIVRLSID